MKKEKSPKKALPTWQVGMAHFVVIIGCISEINLCELVSQKVKTGGGGSLPVFLTQPNPTTKITNKTI